MSNRVVEQKPSDAGNEGHNSLRHKKKLASLGFIASLAVGGTGIVHLFTNYYLNSDNMAREVECKKKVYGSDTVVEVAFGDRILTFQEPEAQDLFDDCVEDLAAEDEVEDFLWIGATIGSFALAGGLAYYREKLNEQLAST